MDIFSLTVGFIVGTVTGAAGGYFADKYTDKRRNIENDKSLQDQWGYVCEKFPSLIEEMKADVENHEFEGVRKFLVKTSGGVLNIREPSFVYDIKDHPKLVAAVALLEDLGYIVDITEGNCPRYRMYEHFIDKLQNA